jgi:hypothetical protein
MKKLLVLAILLASSSAFADPQAVLDAWVKAQTGGDFKAYTALYDKSFVGIRRTSDGAEKKMKLKAWLADRKKMFKLKKVEVTADNAKIDGDTITFLQRWRGGGYEDHGTKVITLSGDLIVKEELLSSTPGWDDDPATTVDATGLKSPLTARVRAEGIKHNDVADCTEATYVLYLKDKKGTVIQKEIGKGIIGQQDDMPTTYPIAPNAKTGLLFDFGEWCAGGGDYYQVKLSGDALVVLYKAADEGDTASD